MTFSTPKLAACASCFQISRLAFQNVVCVFNVAKKCAYCLAPPSNEFPLLYFAVNLKPNTDNFFSAESLV